MILKAILAGVFGFMLSANGFDIRTWQFWGFLILYVANGTIATV